MRASKSEMKLVVDYLASQIWDETVEQLEKVASERVGPNKYDTWSVHTDKDRYWVISSPMNLYLQSQFPHMDLALTFHIGLMTRVIAKSSYSPSSDEVSAFVEPLRRLEQVAEALSHAEEAEDFQAVGMRCRECLIAFVKEAASIVTFADQEERPQVANFVAWADLIAGTVAAGSSAENKRSYLKGIAKSTWQLVNWLTHASNATLSDARFAYQATDWLVSVLGQAFVQFKHGHPERCPQCRSYKLTPEYATEGNLTLHRVVCAACEWEGEWTRITELGKSHAPKRRRPSRKQAASDDCIVMEVPLLGPKPPQPSVPQ